MTHLADSGQALRQVTESARQVHRPCLPFPRDGRNPPKASWTRTCFGTPGRFATFRLTHTQNDLKTTFNVDGQLCGDGVRVTEDACAEAFARGEPVCLVLREVTAIDGAGTDLLRRLIARGVEVHGTGVYTDHVVKSLQGSATAKTGLANADKNRK